MTGTLRILVVDDNDDLRELYSLWLDDSHTVTTAHDGLEALETLSDAFDLVLLDRNMPGPDGLDIARTMRAEGFDGGIVIVSSEQIDFEVPSSPVDNYLEKPADRSDFEHVVEQTVKQKLQSTLNEYYALTESLASVEARYIGSDIEECEEFAAVKRRLEEKQRVIRELLSTGALDWNTAFSVFDDTQNLKSDAVTQAESVVLPNR